MESTSAFLTASRQAPAARWWVGDVRNPLDASHPPGQYRRMDLEHDAYRAIELRDARFDGRFFTAVKTTGTYCQ